MRVSKFWRRTTVAMVGLITALAGVANAGPINLTARPRGGTTSGGVKGGGAAPTQGPATGTTWYAQAPFGAQIFGYRNETVACVNLPFTSAYTDFFTKEFLALPSTEAVEVEFNAAFNLFPETTERLGVSLQCTVEQDTTGGGYDPPVPCSGIDSDPGLAPYITFSSSTDVWGFTQQASYTGYVAVPKADPPVKTRVKLSLKPWRFVGSAGAVLVCNGNIRISY